MPALEVASGERVMSRARKVRSGDGAFAGFGGGDAVSRGDLQAPAPGVAGLPLAAPRGWRRPKKRKCTSSLNC